jgi:hypothetical protein
VLSNLPRIACLAMLLLALPVAFADEIDAVLAQPAPVNASAEVARQRIDELRAQGAAHPERADEIEAWLIPLVRIAEPATPATPTPTPAAPAPEGKPLFVIGGSDGIVSVIRAASFQKQDHALIVIGANGSRAVVQPSSVIAQLQWYSEDELAGGTVPLTSLALTYELTLKRLPASQRGALAAELEKIRAIQKQWADTAAAARTAAHERVQKAIAPVYQVTTDYTREELARLLLAAEKVRRESPQSAARIDVWARPFRAHFENLLAGRKYIRGEWLDQAELDRRALAARKSEFARGLDRELDATSIPSQAIRGAILPPLLSALAVALAAGIGFFFFRERVALRAACVVLLAATPLGLATLLFLATRTPALIPPPLPGEESDSPVITALAEAAGVEPTAPLEVPDHAINAFFHRHVVFKSDDPRNPARRAVAVRAVPGRLLVFEAVRAAGLEWIVRYDAVFRPGGLAITNVQIGRLPCPGPLSSPLWRSLETQLSSWLATTHTLEHFAPGAPGEHVVPLDPRQKPASP